MQLYRQKEQYFDSFQTQGLKKTFHTNFTLEQNYQTPSDIDFTQQNIENSQVVILDVQEKIDNNQQNDSKDLSKMDINQLLNVCDFFINKHNIKSNQNLKPNQNLKNSQKSLSSLKIQENIDFEQTKLKFAQIQCCSLCKQKQKAWNGLKQQLKTSIFQLQNKVQQFKQNKKILEAKLQVFQLNESKQRQPKLQIHNSIFMFRLPCIDQIVKIPSIQDFQFDENIQKNNKTAHQILPNFQERQTFLNSIKQFTQKLSFKQDENKYLKIENRILMKTKQQLQSTRKQLQKTKNQRDTFKKKLINISQKQQNGLQKQENNIKNERNPSMNSGLKARGGNSKNQTLFQLSLTDDPRQQNEYQLSIQPNPMTNRINSPKYDQLNTRVSLTSGIRNK